MVGFLSYMSYMLHELYVYKWLKCQLFNKMCVHNICLEFFLYTVLCSTWLLYIWEQNQSIKHIFKDNIAYIFKSLYLTSIYTG